MRITFVIIEFNCLEEVLALVAHLKAFEGIYRIIVASNSRYTDSQRSTLLREHPAITWVFNKENIGFAAGMNAGLRLVESDYVIIANPDIRIINGSLEYACRMLEMSPQIGMLVPKFIDSNGDTQDYVRRFATVGELLGRIFSRLLHRTDVILYEDFDYDRSQYVDWSAGAFMLIRRDALAQVGLLDEGYFMYVEDMDWCRRFWQNGYRVFYYPELCVMYKGDMKSTAFLAGKGALNRYTWSHLRSQLRYFVKYGLGEYRPTLRLQRGNP